MAVAGWSSGTTDIRGRSVARAPSEFETTEEPGATTRPEEVERRRCPGLRTATTSSALATRRLRPPAALSRASGSSGRQPARVPARCRIRPGLRRHERRPLPRRGHGDGRVVWQKNFALHRRLADGGRNVIYQPLMDPFHAGSTSRTRPATSWRSTPRRGASSGASRPASSSPRRSLVDGSSTSAPGTRTCTRSTSNPQGRLDVPDRRPGEGRPGLRRRHDLLRSYDGKVYAVDARTGKLRWSAGGSAATSTRRRRSPTGGSSSGTRTEGVRLRRRRAATSSGRRRPGASSTRRPRSGRRRSTSAPTRALLRPRRSAPATSSGRSTRAGASRARRPCSTASSTSRRSRRRRSVWTPQTGKKLWEFDDGKYSPIVADKERVYLAGYKRLYGLTPSG